MFHLYSLLIVNLLGPRFIILAPDLLFRCSKFLVIGHIRPQARYIRSILDISDLRPDISDPVVFNYLNQVSFRFDCLFTPSRKLSISIRVILSGKEPNRLKRQCRELGKYNKSHKSSMNKTTPSPLKNVPRREPQMLQLWRTS
jgi:hypothetical protein